MCKNQNFSPFLPPYSKDGPAPAQCSAATQETTASHVSLRHPDQNSRGAPGLKVPCVHCQSPLRSQLFPELHYSVLPPSLNLLHFKTRRWKNDFCHCLDCQAASQSSQAKQESSHHYQPGKPWCSQGLGTALADRPL